MESEELKRFYDYVFLPYFNRSHGNALECMEKSEKYFSGLLNIIITLSAALIAFIGATRQI